MAVVDTLDEAGLQMILDTLDEGVIVLDTAERILYANDSACYHLGVKKNDCVDKLVSELVLELSTADGEPFESKQWPFWEVYKKGEAIKDFELVIAIGRNYRVLCISAYPLKIEEDLHGVTLTIRDITREKIATWKREQFISIIGHELKHPLSSIQAYAYSLRKATRKVSKRAEEYVDRLENQVEVMSDMLNSLLDTSKLVSESLKVDLDLHDLSELVETIIKEIQPRFVSHKIKKSLKSGIPVLLDPIRIRQVIANLISNAVKYSPNADVVHVRVFEDGERAIIEVRDEGLGIERKYLRRIFQPYFRTEGTTASNVKGLGLGLFVAGEIVKKHNGRIEVDSDVNKGTTFRVCLPIVKK